MAEPNTLEWMTEQRDRLKAECDAANNALAANAAQRDLEIINLRGELEQLRRVAERDSAHLTQRIENLMFQASNRRNALLPLFELVGKLHAELGKAIQQD